ncbi:aminodeoxychorismate/anthranilate synthase component II [Fulvivirga ulvae]|uniref:anthranilate synthase component II n=1 Tax=Fulvivirga ulvae TaxID=2904245 RepID=UPI001F2AFF39|nr:aminodeoxychorismate/anthranilate synthase component II [Fulvivirga ulvae]UII34425.1 aminodeoxychorismate/anthranilate synthase component II [Fulvivirga ulvae]
MILLLDNFDSFTYNLVDYFQQLGIKCEVIRNNVGIKDIISGNYQGIVLSPGPEIPEKAGNLMEVLKYYHNKLPVLGICLGHQAIGEFFGARLIKATKPMHGKISKVALEEDVIFRSMPKSINVVRYNSLIVEHENVGDLKVIARSYDGEIMALRHKELPIWGVQFHPEAALTEYGLDILKNWLTYNQIAV